MFANPACQHVTVIGVPLSSTSSIGKGSGTGHVAQAGDETEDQRSRTADNDLLDEEDGENIGFEIEDAEEAEEEDAVAEVQEVMLNLGHRIILFSMSCSYIILQASSSAMHVSACCSHQ